MRTKLGLFAVLPALAGCSVAFGAGVGAGHEGVYYEDPVYVAYGGVTYDPGYARRANYARLPIPRGHLPSPGQCRVWLPGVPPGHQPAPGPCRAMSRRVPAGAWLVARPFEAPGVVEIVHYGDRRPDVRARYVYDVRSKRRVNPRF